MEELHFKIALSNIPGIGPMLARRLVAYTGGVEAVFREKKILLEKVPGIGQIKASLVDRKGLLEEAEKEIDYMHKNNIQALFYLDENYPARLRECEDSPIIIYVKGNDRLNAEKMISIVGTRNASDYGRACTEEIVEYMAARYPEIVIVSGLAFGIDITAHKAAIKNNICTIAALGHGFEFLYPGAHSSYSRRITENGALLTEFKSDKKPEAGNFVSRNRIIAGLADATIIIESAVKGGALITADIANSYNRDVFALPGRSGDPYSKGCNQLIKKNKAALIECGADIEFALGWSDNIKRPGGIQKSLFIELSKEEKDILNFLDQHGDSALDEISISIALPVAKTSASLLNMEFNGLVRTLPGKYFRKN
jgi:DNA processing protein